MATNEPADLTRFRLTDPRPPAERRDPAAIFEAAVARTDRAEDDQRHAREHLARLLAQISAPEYASVRLGYRTVERSDDGSRVTMATSPARDAEQVTFTRGRDGSWTYASERAAQERGTFEDFARVKLRLSGEQLARDLERAELEKKLRKLPALDIPTSSMARLGIRPETINSPPFRGALRLDTLGYLALAQRDRGGFCGIERVSAASLEAGRAASSFNGERGLWVSNAAGPRDAKLVITATPVEALAYHQLHPTTENVRYVCTGSADLTPSQKESLQLALAGASKLGRAPEVVLAFGRDGQGEKLARDVTALCRDQVVRRHVPDLGSSWAQVLQLRERDHIRSLGHHVGAGLHR